MLTYEEALALANAYYRKSGEFIVKAWEHPDYWIFFGNDNSGQPKIGGRPITFSKKNGKRSSLFLFDVKDAAILDAATPIKLD